MPLDDAFYLSSADKIFGTCSNYIIRFNATTGLKEASAKMPSPMYGPMRIGGTATTLYVSAINDWSVNGFPVAGRTCNKDIFQVDPTTLVASQPFNLSDILFTYFGQVPTSWYSQGPTDFRIIGDWLYLMYIYEDNYSVERIYVPDISSNPYPPWPQGHLGTIPQQMDAYDSTHLYYCDVDWFSEQAWWQTYTISPPLQVQLFNTSETPPPVHPVGIGWSAGAGQAFSVTGSETLVQSQFDGVLFGGNPGIGYNLGTVQANVRPFRIRVHPSTGKLYIPCQVTDTVIIWNPISNNPADAVLKTGFTSPIDVVFTPTKAFAVQTGLVGLKEIV